jgi:hypothetical protein
MSVGFVIIRLDIVSICSKNVGIEMKLPCRARRNGPRSLRSKGTAFGSTDLLLLGSVDRHLLCAHPHERRLESLNSFTRYIQYGVPTRGQAGLVKLPGSASLT